MIQICFHMKFVIYIFDKFINKEKRRRHSMGTIVQFDQVTYTYPGAEKPAIHDISL